MKKDNLFKEYSQNQRYLFPPSVEDFIPEGHLVRVVNRILDQLDISGIVAKYPGGGASAYHPRMLLKVLVYAYLEGVYSSRKIAKALRENVMYMWLAGMQRPDFRTINHFRGKRLQGEIKEIFKQVVMVAMELGLVSFEKLFVDGTKMAANANKHRVVWRKNVERNKAKVEERIQEIFEEIERVNQEEDKLYGDKDLPEVGEGQGGQMGAYEEKIREGVKKLNKKLGRKKRRLEKQLRELEERKRRYEESEKVLGDRNSYAKADHDATVMRMKNGQTRPGYNFVIGTEGQVVIHYEIEPYPSDGRCFRDLMEGFAKLYRRLPKKVHGDGAFGNEENYAYCEEKGVEAYLKFPTFHVEKQKRFREDIFRKEHFTYDEAEDVYLCPEGRRLVFFEEKEEETATGYKRRVKVYVGENCGGCRFLGVCTKGDRRSIRRNEDYERYKRKARELLESEEGRALRRQRRWDVETPFGDMKHNRGFRRFLLRGKRKVEVEAGLLMIGHNIRKIGMYLVRKVKEGMMDKVGGGLGVEGHIPVVS